MRNNKNIEKQKTETTNFVEQEENAKQEIKQNCQNVEYAVDTSFFYTNDKFINSIDDEDIANFLLAEYPNLNVKNTDQ